MAAQISNRQGIYKHIPAYNLKAAIDAVARNKALIGIAQIVLVLDQEQKASLLAAAKTGQSAELDRVIIATNSGAKAGQNYTFDNAQLRTAMAEVAADKKYGVELKNGYFALKGAFIPAEKGAVSGAESTAPIKTEKFKAVKAEPKKAAQVKAEPDETDAVEADQDSPAQSEAKPEKPAKAKKEKAD